MNAAERQSALDRARQGDALALGQLLESLRPYVLVLARSLGSCQLGARLDQSDIAQDALLEVHRSFRGFAGENLAEFVAWMRKIVVRCAGHSVRVHLGTGKRSVSREQSGVDLDALADSGSTPSAEAIRHEHAALMAEALTRLPEEMQQVLLGRLVDGLPHAELAKRLDKSEVAVRVLFSRAVRHLREECRQDSG
jgi:RNA polymerase sigma-70 factor (ECF subfamily)